MNTLQVQFRIVTPLFMGGASPDERAELREPSIKGLLRYWYRAIDPTAYRDNEARIFGGSGRNEGQSSFLLRVKGPRHDVRSWQTKIPAGIKYFSFPFKMKPNDKKYIPEDQNVTLTLMFKRPPATQDRYRILASLWLLGHVGGLGSRSRRGFGTVALQSWQITQGSVWDELNKLDLVHEANSPATWMDVFEKNLVTMRSWFPGCNNFDHLTFGRNTRFKLIDTPNKDWRTALNHIGEHMQTYRQRYSLEDPGSDYHRVKAHVCHRDTQANQINTSSAHPITPARLSIAPHRIAFGLPLTMRYSSLKYLNKKGDSITPGVTFKGNKDTHDRSASRIFIRIIAINSHYYPLVSQFDGPLLSNGEKIKDEHGSYSVPPDSILDEFWNSLPEGKEITW